MCSYHHQALDALKSDSQKGTFGKRGDKPKVDPAYLDQADKVHLDKMNLYSPQRFHKIRALVEEWK